MKILNLTQHLATEEQKAAGVFEPKNKELVKELLTFDDLPDYHFLVNRAAALAQIAFGEGIENQYGNVFALIGGAPFFMAFLERALKDMANKTNIKCSICGGDFKFSPVTFEKNGIERKGRILQCDRCGDTKGSPEQYFGSKS